jgi:intracellular sulfur oxidation DsrE/DsrF family protein
MRPILVTVPAMLALAVPALISAQSSTGMQRSGPVIHSAGPTFGVESPSFVMPADHDYKVVWEMVDGADEPTEMDAGYVTLARFMNLHARHGVDPERIQLAAVVHGAAWQALLSDEAYGERFDGVANPTRELIQELLANNVEIVLCGQTAGSRGVTQGELLPGVKMGLSAMTALHWFQSEGYTLNPW